MKQNQLFIFIALAAINFFVVYFFRLKITFQQVFTMHLFLFSLFFLTGLIKGRFLKQKKPAVYTLLSINFLRILACIFFLSPVFFIEEKKSITYVYNFFICYFFYLFDAFFLPRKNINK